MEEDVRSDLQTGALCILALSGIVCNGFIFLLFYNRRSVRTFSNRFVLSLASCHILQCTLIIPSFIASVRKLSFGDTWCKITASFTVCINLATVLSILLIAIDRNCAVNSPLHYTVTITKKRAGLLISFVWLVSTVLAVPTLFGVPRLEEAKEGLASASVEFERITGAIYTITLSVIGFALPLISVTYLYFAMFRAAETNNARARRNSSNSCISNDVVVNIKPPKNFGENEYSLRRNFSSEHTEPKGGYCCFAGQHKAAVTGIIVVASFVTCWSPYFLTLVYQQIKVDHYITPEIKFWVQFATYLSCILNPYVYFYRNKNTWKQTKKLISRMIHRKSDFIAHPIARRNKIDTSRCVLRLPTSFSHSVLATQTPLKSSFSHNSIPEDKAHKHIVLGQEVSTNQKVFSVDPIKSLMHQDSSSSNDSSDACVTTVMMGSCLSIDADSPMWYQAFHQRFSDVSMTEIPLDDVVTI